MQFDMTDYINRFNQDLFIHLKAKNMLITKLLCYIKFRIDKIDLEKYELNDYIEY